MHILRNSNSDFDVGLSWENIVERLLLVLRASVSTDIKITLIINDEETHDLLLRADSPNAGLVRMLQGEPVTANLSLPVEALKKAQSTREIVLVDNFVSGNLQEIGFPPGVNKGSAVCLPLIDDAGCIGIIYIKNNSHENIFNPRNIAALKKIAAHYSILISAVRSSKKGHKKKSTIDEQLNSEVAFFQWKNSDEYSTLNTIIDVVENMLDRSREKAGEETHRNLSLVLSSAKQLHTYLHEVKNPLLPKHQEVRLNKRPVDLRELAELVVSIHRQIIPNEQRAFKIINSMPEDIPPVVADESRIYQVLQNLVANAIKYSESGTVEVTGAILPGGRELQITVSDNGCGLSDAKWNHLVHTFENGALYSGNVSGDKGAGLMICMDLIRMHGGDIWFEPNVKSGSRINFTLPFGSNASPGQELPRSIGSNRSGLNSAGYHRQLDNNHKILVLDNTRLTGQVTLEYLEGEAFRTDLAKPDSRALDLIDTDAPDILLLNLPENPESEIRFYQELKSDYIHKYMPVILMAGKNQLSYVPELLDAGSTDYLLKPFSKTELLACVRNHITNVRARELMSTLRTFANQISNIKDIDRLIHRTYAFLAEDKYALEVAIFKDGNVLHHFGENKDEFEDLFLRESKVFDQNPNSYYSVRKSSFDYLMAQLKGVNIWTFIVKWPKGISELEKEYVHNVIHQARLIQDNLHQILCDPSVLADLHRILSNADDILFIQSANQYIEVHASARKVELLKMSLQRVSMYLKNVFLQVHRSYLINPVKVREIRRKANSGHYEMVVGQKTVPVGSSYLAGLRAEYPHWFRSRNRVCA